MLATTNAAANLVILLKCQTIPEFVPYLRVASCRCSERHSPTLSLVPIRKELYLHFFSDSMSRHEHTS
jgi:hypothetical protein